MLRRLSLLSLVVVYALLFSQHERFSHWAQPQLSFPLPASVEKAVLGYIRQLGGEFHFIKSSLYVGALSARRQDLSGADNLAANLDSAAELNPPFVDTYFYCESFLAPQGQVHVRQANAILKKGIAARPQSWLLPFFLGFNHINYLGEPREAADALKAASERPTAPSWLGHLASVLAAKGGDINTGLMWLRAMHANEKNEAVRRGYADDIADYEKALEVQKAVRAFSSRYGREPRALNALVPEFLSGLPVFKGNLILKWEPPVLRLERPRKTSSRGLR
jgi:hypothetical protein